MKNNLIILFVIFGIGQIQCEVINNIISYGKFRVYKDADTLHCGSLTCPVTSRCIITQKNDQNDTSKLITREKCFNEDDELINSSEVVENADINQSNVNLRIESGRNGNVVTSRNRSDEAIKKDMDKHAERLRNHLEEIRLRNEERQRKFEEQRIEREQRLTADANRRAIEALERQRNLEEQRIEREQRLTADANRRAIEALERKEKQEKQMEEIRLRNEERQRNLEEQRIERGQRLTADANRRAIEALERKEKQNF